MKLNDISTIRTGLVLARKQSTMPDSGIMYKVLTLSSIDSSGNIIDGNVVDFCASSQISSEYISQLGDVLVRLSFPYISTTIDSQHTGIIIPSHFAIVRITDQSILPQYLQIVLNHKLSQPSLQKYSSGTAIKVISNALLRDISINVIPLSRQQSIVNLHNAMQLKILLQQLIYEHEQKIFDYKLHNLTGGNTQ